MNKNDLELRKKSPVQIRNKKASFEYNFIDTYTAGIQLTGTEIKSIRMGKASVDEWGKRRLAYPINDLNEGYYVLMNFESKPEFPAELERVMKITEGVMRCLTTAVEE